MYAKLFFSLLVVSFAALFAVQSAEAVRGPKITHMVYFDIKHGDEDLGRSKYCSHIEKLSVNSLNFSHHGSLRWSM